MSRSARGASLTRGEDIDEEVVTVEYLIAAGGSVSPTSAGMPGAELIGRLLSWLSQLALWGSLASILVGSGPWPRGRTGNASPLT